MMFTTNISLQTFCQHSRLLHFYSNLLKSSTLEYIVRQIPFFLENALKKTTEKHKHYTHTHTHTCYLKQLPFDIQIRRGNHLNVLYIKLSKIKADKRKEKKHKKNIHFFLTKTM